MIDIAFKPMLTVKQENRKSVPLAEVWEKLLAYNLWLHLAISTADSCYYEVDR